MAGCYDGNAFTGWPICCSDLSRKGAALQGSVMTQTSNFTKRASHSDSLIQKRTRLLKAIQALGAKAKSSVSHRIALAEAKFRLSLHEQTDLLEALELIQSSIEHDPFHPKYFFHYGRLLHRNGDYRGAVHEYKHALKLAPASHRTFVHLALALLELQEAEKNLGRRILDALVLGAEHDLGQYLIELDELMAIQLTEGKKLQSISKRKRQDSKDDQHPIVPCRWNGVWRLSLIEQLSRPKLIRKQIDKKLRMGTPGPKGQTGIAEYALACLFLLLSGDSPKAIKTMLQDKMLQPHANHPAVQLLSAAVAIATCDDVDQFVMRAQDDWQANSLPLEIICCLHYMKFGPDSALSVSKALNLLNAYPPAMQMEESFNELRLAVEDGYARRAWTDQRYNHARMLWRETIPLDPNRIAVSHNLALVAARTKTQADYGPAWDRATELRYLHAAAAGDVQVMLEDRRTLHLAFAQQSKQRYCTSPQSPEQPPKEEELEAWLADKDALRVWLREWDLYYLNSRLRFRSPVHLLGVPRDATDETVTEARDAFLNMLNTSLRSESWAGIKTFCYLVEDRVSTAFDQALDLVTRARDVYYEDEKTQADELSAEAIDRGFVIHRMMTVMAEKPTTQYMTIGCTIARHLFALPWKTLQPICIARGKIRREDDLLKIFESYFLALITADKSEPKTAREVSARLTVLDESITILPHRVELRVVRCQILLMDQKNAEAYSAALEALPLISKVEDREEAHTLKHNLIIVVDNAALAELPEEIRNPSTLEQAEATLEKGLSVLEKFPHAAGLRTFLVNLLLQLDGKKRTKEAVKLLEKGVELVLNEEQTQELQSLLQKAGVQSQVAGKMDKVRKLLEDASQRVSDAVAKINLRQDLKAMEEACQVLASSIKDVEQAKRLAEKTELHDAASQAEQMLQQFKEVQAKLCDH
ncbi:MAG: hypothetical protein GY774_40145 [Planctomycetes bacterium]|nr:hypothetical protein [Planctomycetota bacterium]